MNTNIINRKRTAISRKVFSRPYKIMLGKGLITPEQTILDYGCGRGEDFIRLWDVGYKIYGYDKFHEDFSNYDTFAMVKNWDVVTCNYVFNVIEDVEERMHLLAKLKGISKKLIISVRSDKKSIQATWMPFNDGYITGANTFQKFYTLEDVQLTFNNTSAWEFELLSNNSNEIMFMLTDRKN